MSAQKGLYVSPSPPRNRRVQVFSYQDAGANGVVNVIYPFVAEYWAAVNEMSGKQTDPTLQAEHIVDAEFLFLDEATITPNGMLMVVDTQDRYFVRAIRKMPEMRTLVVQAQRIDDSVFAGPAVVVTPNQVDLPAGFLQALSAIAYDISGNVVGGATFTWTSSNTGVATVDSSGNVTAVANGSAVITATQVGTSPAVTGSCNVLVQSLLFGP